MKAPPVREVELFDRDALNFEEYLNSPLGRLRTELIWSGLVPLLDQGGAIVTYSMSEAVRGLLRCGLPAKVTAYCC